jgi:Helicase HerA, central domain
MNIGQIIGGGKLELDLPTLVDTRVLIQANSGGGKSWLLRLIAERAGIQTIVLDNVLKRQSISGPGRDSATTRGASPLSSPTNGTGGIHLQRKRL